MKLLLTILLFISVAASGQKIFAINSSPPVSSLPGGGDTTVLCVSPTTSFLSNWTTDPARGLWETINYTPGRIVPGILTWHGRTSAKVTCIGGDNTACDGTCDRDEVAEMVQPGVGQINEEDYLGETIYYSASYKIPGAWSSHANWQLVLQLHGPTEFGTNPLFALFLSATKYSFTWKSGDLSGAISSGSLDIGNINFDAWTDFIIVVNYQKTATGFIKVYRRDEGATGWQLLGNKANIPTYQYDNTVSGGALLYHYWKQGIYREHVVRTDVLNMGPVARGTSFADVECAAFGTNNGVAN